MSKVFGAVLVALVMSLVACSNDTGGPREGGGGGIGGIGGGGGGGDAGGGGGGGGGSTTPTTTDLVVQNDSAYAIWYLYVSPSWSSDWGSDQLGSEILDPGESYRLTGIPCDDN